MEIFFNSKNYDSIYLFQDSLQNESNKMVDVGVSDGVNREIFFNPNRKHPPKYESARFDQMGRAVFARQSIYQGGQ